MNIQLVISFDQATGQVSVSGPIDNKLLSYGLLEVARDTIAAHKATNGIVPIRAKLPEAN